MDTKLAKGLTYCERLLALKLLDFSRDKLTKLYLRFYKTYGN